MKKAVTEEAAVLRPPKKREVSDKNSPYADISSSASKADKDNLRELEVRQRFFKPKG